LRAQVDARNELDTVAYQVQRTMDETAGAVPEHQRARAELLLNDARTALQEQAPTDRLRSSRGSCSRCSNRWLLRHGRAPQPGLQRVRQKAREGNRATTLTT
jgi:hypothetical protein